MYIINQNNFIEVHKPIKHTLQYFQSVNALKTCYIFILFYSFLFVLFSVTDLKKKIHSLRTSYSRQKGIILNTKLHGKPNKPQGKAYYLFDELDKFLGNHVNVKNKKNLVSFLSQNLGLCLAVMRFFLLLKEFLHFHFFIPV